MATAISQWSKHMKRILLPGIGRFSAVTFGPLGARSQLPSRARSAPCCSVPRPQCPTAGEKEPGVKRIADFLLSEDILLDVDCQARVS